MAINDTRKAQGRRLAAAREAAGYRSAREAALANGWAESSYRAHEAGTRTIGDDDAERYARRFRSRGAKTSAKDILFGDGDGLGDQPNDQRVPIMGYIGAGAEIRPEFEQVPPEGLHQVDLPFAIPEEIIGFEVRGDSMLPRYDDGDVILCWREATRPITALLGEELAVRTSDGRRYLKRVTLGRSKNSFDLESWNARTIEDVRLDWYSDIYLTVRAGQRKRIEQRERAASRRKAVALQRATKGMEELPLDRKEG